mmetsp:Transcript_60331/g.136370  ORF Transcript_60331/g.136370 Transcript_60331/m.136370 type:complete len:392 (+) Transcript_60331:613-1788(+)
MPKSSARASGAAAAGLTVGPREGLGFGDSGDPASLVATSSAGGDSESASASALASALASASSPPPDWAARAIAAATAGLLAPRSGALLDREWAAACRFFCECESLDGAASMGRRGSMVGSGAESSSPCTVPDPTESAPCEADPVRSVRGVDAPATAEATRELPATSRPRRPDLVAEVGRRPDAEVGLPPIPGVPGRLPAWEDPGRRCADPGRLPCIESGGVPSLRLGVPGEVPGVPGLEAGMSERRRDALSRASALYRFPTPSEASHSSAASQNRAPASTARALLPTLCAPGPPRASARAATVHSSKASGVSPTCLRKAPSCASALPLIKIPRFRIASAFFGSSAIARRYMASAPSRFPRTVSSRVPRLLWAALCPGSISIALRYIASASS